jgi:hypothetical protein
VAGQAVACCSLTAHAGFCAVSLAKAELLLGLVVLCLCACRMCLGMWVGTRLWGFCFGSGSNPARCNSQFGLWGMSLIWCKWQPFPASSGATAAPSLVLLSAECCWRGVVCMW